MKPHDNPHWRDARRERDIERILQGKPIESDTLKAMYAPNAYALAWRMVLTRELSLSARTRLSIIGALLAGLLVDLRNKLLRREPRPEPESSEIAPDIEEFPF